MQMCHINSCLVSCLKTHKCTRIEIKKGHKLDHLIHVCLEVGLENMRNIKDGSLFAKVFHGTTMTCLLKIVEFFVQQP